MNKIKITSLRDRVKAAIRAFRGQPIGSLCFGIEVKRCSECHAVPVVRCKDCVHYRAGKHFTDINFCQRLPYYAEKGGLNTADNDFCSYGERRDSDGKEACQST